MICGSYGQGKSHSLNYLRQKALEKGFVTSMINLDPREIPFYNFRLVYQALISQIQFPNMETSLMKVWKNWIKEKKPEWKNNGRSPLKYIPKEMPHYFKTVLTALAHENMKLTKRQKKAKKHAAYKPREFPHILSNALNGSSVPVYRLRQVLKYRHVDCYKDASLACRGWEPYFQTVLSMPALFQKMGFNGWVILFDEGESISQMNVNARSKSYEILNQMFNAKNYIPGFYPIFAFTDDFFMQVESEDYDRVRIRKEVEYPYFAANYANAWKGLNKYFLNDLAAKEWQALSEKLSVLHAKAYNWQPDYNKINTDLAECLSKSKGRDARLRVKALVNQLDLAYQDTIL